MINQMGTVWKQFSARGVPLTDRSSGLLFRYTAVYDLYWSWRGANERYNTGADLTVHQGEFDPSIDGSFKPPIPLVWLVLKDLLVWLGLWEAARSLFFFCRPSALRPPPRLSDQNNGYKKNKKKTFILFSFVDNPLPSPSPLSGLSTKKNEKNFFCGFT